MPSILQCPCLGSSKSLRTQLFSSFGLAAFLSLLVVVVSACISVYTAGEIVKQHSNQLMKEQVTDSLLGSSKLVAEKLSAYMVDVENTIQILVETVQDRIVGYPDLEGWEEGRHVPFLDHYTQQPKYPLSMSPVPLDWNLTSWLLTEEDNLQEHLQERRDILQNVSTSSGSYHMQGSCDPDPISPYYVEGCSSLNNDLRTGGVLQPTETHWGLYQSTGDLTVFLKPLYEIEMDALKLNVHFVNQGAGASLQYPGSSIPPNTTYTSQGCDWMSQTNPRTGKPYGTKQEISRCHKAGTQVPPREYNPMEEPWCPMVASQPDKVGWYGPIDGHHNVTTIVKAGKAVFDRITGALIGFVTADITTASFIKDLDTNILAENSDAFVIPYDDGVIVSATYKRFDGHEEALLSVFDEFRTAVNFDEPWSAETLEAYEKAIPYDSGHSKHSGRMTAYPLPLPPDEYEPTYRPKYLVVHAIDGIVFALVTEIDDSIDQGVLNIILLSILLGLIALVTVLVIAWGVSRVLTQPLLWIREVARSIVNNNAEDGQLPLAEEDETSSATVRCAPRTEINQLVSEFRSMVTRFSGEGGSRVAEPTPLQIKNELTWHSDFQHLYSPDNGKKKSCKVSVDTVHSTTKSEPGFQSALIVVPAPLKLNRQPVVGAPISCSKPLGNEKGTRACRSSLFWWIVILIIIPILLTNATIAHTVATSISTTIPAWVKDAEEASQLIESQALQNLASSKASVMSTIVHGAIRDLHFMTRIAGWLFFDGVRRSDSFTQMDTAVEECKAYAPNTCPLFQSDRVPCSCDWWCQRETTCQNYNVSDSRFLQTQWFVAQARDVDPETGNRFSSPSFPEFGNTTDTTLWWDDISSLPGSEKGANASGYNTTYDRVRVSSAAAAFYFPVYNYATSLGMEKHFLGSYLSFENDGLFKGWAGCYYLHGNSATTRSTKENRAALIAPQLCPEGKYGYDPRCRGWYATGREMYKTSAIPVHVTSPYKFHHATVTATSATSPIANPETGEYVGQVLLDYFSLGLRSSISKLDKPLSFLITPEEDVTGGDTVLGPNKTAGWKSSAIGDLLFTHESASTNREKFESKILSSMKGGDQGIDSFTWTKDDGSEEDMNIAFAPVSVRVMLPVSPDDFSRGVNVSEILVYSVGIGHTIIDMNTPFMDVQDEMEEDLKRLEPFYIYFNAFISCVFVLFTTIIAMYVAKPMIALLEIVKNTNRGKFDEDIPPLHGGCREVQQVYNTFAKLNKIVRFSNTAFFSGNLEMAHHFVSDALRLFRKVNDQKAIAIACNNLANTLFAIRYEMMEAVNCCSSKADCMIAQALLHYDEAIELGERDFNSAPDGELKVDFAQQLADRHFNRGLFLLFIDGYECAPSAAREKGYHDITRARNLHYDVREYLLEHKLLFENAASYYGRLLRRINCLAAFYDDVGLRKVWDAEVLLDEADQLVRAAWDVRASPLFQRLSRVGRRQQLEASAILLALNSGQNVRAANLAMRMFAEDRYILESSFVRAAEALLQMMRDDEASQLTRKAIASSRDDLRSMLKCCKNESLDIGKNVIFAFELSGRWAGNPVLEKMNAQCLDFFDQCFSQDDNIGVVANSVKDTLAVELGAKEENEGRQRAFIDVATSSTSDYPFQSSLAIGVQMVIDSGLSLQSDSFIFLITDGTGLNSTSLSSLKAQIERLNQERKYQINLLIIGLEIEQEHVKEQYMDLCGVSKSSMFRDATSETLDASFDLITAVIVGRQSSSNFINFLTMEKF